MFAPIASQYTVGRIDLLVDLGSTFPIVDHKSFPGRAEFGRARPSVRLPNSPPMRRRSAPRRVRSVRAYSSICRWSAQ